MAVNVMAVYQSGQASDYANFDVSTSLHASASTQQSYDEYLNEVREKEDIKNTKIGPELNKLQQKRVRGLLKQWKGLFSTNPSKPPHYSGPEFRIPTGEAAPLKFLPYRQAPCE